MTIDRMIHNPLCAIASLNYHCFLPLSSLRSIRVLTWKADELTDKDGEIWKICDIVIADDENVRLRERAVLVARA